MRSATLVVPILLIALAGCETDDIAPPPAGPVAVFHIAPFVATDYNWASAPGTAAVSGDILLRTVGGDVKTCAGLRVALVPSGPYADDFVRTMFGNNAQAFLPAGSGLSLMAAHNQMEAIDRHTICDAQGHFQFTGLPPGAYYVVGAVVWERPNLVGDSVSQVVEGGSLMQRVELAAGESKTLVLTA